MAVKFSEFPIGAINADLELVGFNSATPANVQVSYNDIRDSILNLTLNIYNANGTLTSNRILSTAGNTIAFRTGGVDEFLFTPTNGSTAPIFKVFNVSFGGKLDLGYGYFQVGGGALSFGTNNSGNIDIFAGTQKAKIFGGTGNVLIQTGGTFVDTGEKLQVTGTSLFRGTLTVNTPDSAITLQNNSCWINFGGTKFIGNATNLIGGNTDGQGYRGAAHIFGTGTTGFQYFSSQYAIFYNGDSGPINLSTLINTSAVVQISSTTRGFLPPRMTTAQKNAIGTPAAGLQVYDTTLNQMSYYNGTTWINF